MLGTTTSECYLEILLKEKCNVECKPSVIFKIGRFKCHCSEADFFRLLCIDLLLRYMCFKKPFF